MGTASGAFTALFGIDFPKAIYKGNVLGLSVRAPKSVFRERPIEPLQATGKTGSSDSMDRCDLDQDVRKSAATVSSRAGGRYL